MWKITTRGFTLEEVLIMAAMNLLASGDSTSKREIRRDTLDRNRPTHGPYRLTAYPAPEGKAVRVVAAVQGRSSRQTQIENQTLRPGLRDKTEGIPSESIAQPVGVASGLLPHVSRSKL